MSNREQVQAAGRRLSDATAAVRLAAAAELHRMARERASLLPVKDALVTALEDTVGQVQVDAALALLVDSWRFAGLMPVIDELRNLTEGGAPGAARAALTTAASLRGDVPKAGAVLVPLLAHGLPRTVEALRRLAGQGADVGPALAAIERQSPAPHTPMGDLWLSALGRTEPRQVLARSGRLRGWMQADEADWRYDDVRHRAAGLLCRAALQSGDEELAVEIGQHPHAAVREAAMGAWAESLAAGRLQRQAIALLATAAEDVAGGVRYAAVKGLCRAVAAGANLVAQRRALAELAPRAEYLSTGWTHPLDAAACSDLRGESAAADLAEAAATLAVRAGDAILLAELRGHANPEVARGASANRQET
ncbi:MAG: hypothetical protein FJ100_21155 [Deltaproteobacteria bacterium]|nr:hypothetical protein [Deltaproteobacteria bacterium]